MRSQLWLSRYLPLFLAMLTVLPLAAGCATGGGNQVQNAVYDTHRRVANLEKNMQGSVQQLNETAAGLLARVDANDQALRGVAGALEENRAKLDIFEKKLDALIRTYRQQRAPLPVSGAASGQSEVEIGDQDFVVENTAGSGTR